MADHDHQTNESQFGAPLGVVLADPAQHSEPAPAPRREAKPADKHGWWWGTGRRKTAVARVRLRSVKPDKARVTIQRTGKDFRSIEEHFSEPRDRNDCYAALKLTGTQDQFECIIRVHGGGTTGQAQAIRLGIARALRDFDPNLEQALRQAGYLTRDARKVERKKYGQPGARRRFQFSKR